MAKLNWCQNSPVWRIEEYDDPYNYSYSCTRHLPEMITDKTIKIEKSNDDHPCCFAYSEEDIIFHFIEMCQQSINPDLYSILVEKIIPALRMSRKALKDEN